MLLKIVEARKGRRENVHPNNGDFAMVNYLGKNYDFQRVHEVKLDNSVKFDNKVRRPHKA